MDNQNWTQSVIKTGNEQSCVDRRQGRGNMGEWGRVSMFKKINSHDTRKQLKKRDVGQMCYMVFLMQLFLYT